MTANIETVNKIKLQLLLKDYVTAEANANATALKLELINQLLNNELKYINVIQYYYDIKNAANE